MSETTHYSRHTRTVLAGVGRDEATGAISFPIYPSATYRHPALGQSTGYDYTRSGNPTRQILEETLAALEDGSRGLAFASGMAALTTLFLHFSAGDHLVVSADLYGGTYRVLDQIFGKFRLHASYVDTSDTETVAAACRPETKALLVETPGNPLLGIADLPALVEMCRSKGFLLLVDNTFLTPMLQRPLAIGADVVIHSATKYLGGHNDLCAGALIARDPQLGEELYFLQNSTGAILPPQDCWLLLRSLKTLGLRMERHCQNAQHVAEWLQRHPQVRQVYYPGLPGHSGHRRNAAQAEGHGGMISFRLASAQQAAAVLERLQRISFAESLGGVETLITLPAVQTHADIPAEERARLGVCESLLRLSVGIEDAADIIADLEQALA